MAGVSAMAAPHARDPFAQNVTGVPKAAATHWFPGSWRDSRVGYANGRFAMDINAIWVPQALESIGVILGTVHALGLPPLESLAPEVAGMPITEYDRDPEALRRAVETWRGAARHFEVAFTTAELRAHVNARLDSLPVVDRRS